MIKSFDNIQNMTKIQYQKPEANAVNICLEGALLSGSVLKTLGVLEANESTGENITFTSPVDPW